MIQQTQRRGFTLVEIMLATILGLVMAGIMTFFLDSLRTTFITQQKLNISGDIRDVTNKLADEAREANYFAMYSSFYPNTPPHRSGDFRSPADGFSAEDYRQRKGNSGDFLLLVYTGIDTSPNDNIHRAPDREDHGLFPRWRLLRHRAGTR